MAPSIFDDLTPEQDEKHDDFCKKIEELVSENSDKLKTIGEIPIETTLALVQNNVAKLLKQGATDEQITNFIEDVLLNGDLKDLDAFSDKATAVLGK